MFTTLQPLILASGSPRRRVLLAQLGIDFDVEVPEVDESLRSTEGEQDYVLRLARLKGEAVGERNPSSWVVAADTVVAFGERLLTKPDTEERAVDMLMLLSGQEHQVRTGFCLYCRTREVNIVRSTLTRVRFRPFPRKWAEAYVQTGEPMDKAGAYGIQGQGGVLVESISGSYSNVVGLPLVEVVELLGDYQVVVSSADGQ